MKYRIVKTIVVCSLLIGAMEGNSQTDWKKTFPAAEAIYTNLSNDVTIKLEDGKWIAASSLSEDLLFLTDNSVKMMSRGRIYHSSFNELEKWHAYVQLPERKKISVSNTTTASSKQDYVFYDDSKSTSFDYAGAIVGATRHMDYKLKHNDVHLLTPHYFERYFPVGESELRVTFPSDIKLKYIIKGLNRDKVEFKEIKKGSKTTYTFTVNNLNNIATYPDAPDNSYYATHVIYYIEQIREHGVWKNFLSTPEDLHAHSYGFVKNINKVLSPELKQQTELLVKDALTEREKASKIYKWVQSNIKYVAFEDGLEGFIPRDASLVCSRKYGDCKDMTSILTAMLNYAHIPAYFTWIGTRDIPYDYTEVPLPISDNHMICTIKLGDEYLFLDGTDEGCIFGVPPFSIQGKQAMVSIAENEFKLLRVPITPKEANKCIDSTFLRWDKGELTGRIKVYMTGYYASEIQTILHFKNEKEREEYLKLRFARGTNKISFTNWKLELSPTHNESLITADFTLPDYVRSLSDEAFLNLNLFKFYEHEEIDFPKRKVPIQFNFLASSSSTTVMSIPDGYETSYVPKGETFKNDVWGFSMQYGRTANSIFLTQVFESNQLLLKPEQFEPWNKVLEHLFPHYRQTVAFKKK
jgi:hypothetical protein